MANTIVPAKASRLNDRSADSIDSSWMLKTEPIALTRATRERLEFPAPFLELGAPILPSTTPHLHKSGLARSSLGECLCDPPGLFGLPAFLFIMQLLDDNACMIMHETSFE
jgi:hypothetical protein